MGTKFFQKNKLKGAGFTLLELLVGVALFIVVIAIIISVFLSLLSSQNQHMQAQNIVDNSRFVLEKISRAVRQGRIVSASGGVLQLCHPTIGYTDATCVVSCPLPKRCLEYSLDAVRGRILEKSGDSLGNPLPAVSFTSSNLWVRNFILSGTGIGIEVAPSPQIQQKVTISLFLVPSSSVLTPEFVFQTTVSSRKLEI